MPGIGIPELAIVLIIVLLIFGPKRLPQLGKQLGGGMREFKDSIQGKGKDDGEDVDAFGNPELTRAQQADVLDPTPDATHAPVGDRDESATRPGG
ncbi:MAG: twin-arginine translocase TatA/TatE family subunit [Baekduia sp.]